MAETVESLTKEAIELPPDQRLTLAQRILASLEPDETSESDAAWEAEIRERIRRYDRGESKGISASEVFADLNRRLGG